MTSTAQEGRVICGCSLSLMEGITVTTQVIIPPVPTPSSHLHWERRLKLPGLGWQPPWVYSGLSIPVLTAGVCSDNKDKGYYQVTQQTIQSVNVSQMPSVIYKKPEAPPVPTPPPSIPAQPTPPWLGSSTSGRDNRGSRSELP